MMFLYNSEISFLLILLASVLLLLWVVLCAIQYNPKAKNYAEKTGHSFRSIYVGPIPTG